MELAILQDLFNLKSSNSLQILLDGFDENQSFDVKTQTDASDIIKLISSLLADINYFSLGIKLLNKFLCQSNYVSEQKLNLCTDHILKLCLRQEIRTQSVPVFEALTIVAIYSFKRTEFKKVFTSTYLGKIYECISNSISVDQLGALHCIETCLKIYPNASIQYRGTIEKYLIKYVDYSNEGINYRCGKCYHFLQQLQKNSAKNQWLSYQLNLLGSLQKIFNQIFEKCLHQTKENLQLQEIQLPNMNLSDEPVQRMLQLHVRFSNLLIWLIAAISEPFPTEKPITKSKIIQLIQRGLSVNRNSLEQNSIYDNLVLISLLPKIHLYLLRLMHVLMQALGTHLKSDFRVIISVLVDSLQWTNSKKNYGKKPYMQLRIKTYNLISFWCEQMEHGSCCELTIEELLSNIFSDISPLQMGLTLKTVSGPQSKISKKARRQANRLQNNQSNIMQTYSSNSLSSKHNSLECKNDKLCTAALCCLQQILKSGVTYFKAPLVKTIQDKIYLICCSLNNFSSTSQHLYSDWKCRLELLKTINVLLTATHHLCPPDFHYVLNILQLVFKNDNNEIIRKNNSEILLMLENIVHPKKESLSFPIEVRNIQNAFIKFGQENLLQNTHFNCSVQNNDDAEISIQNEKIQFDEPQNERVHFEEIQNKQTDECTSTYEINTGIITKQINESYATSESSELLLNNEKISFRIDKSEMEFINCENNILIDKNEEQPSSPKKPKIIKDNISENFTDKNCEQVMDCDSLFDDIIADFVDELN